MIIVCKIVCHFDDEDDFISAISESWVTADRLTIKNLEDKLFNPFDLTDNLLSSQSKDCDPDIHYYSDVTYIDNLSNCVYYLEDSFTKKLFCSMLYKSFSIIHLTIRSIPRKLHKFDTYLKNLNYKLIVIGIPESWLSDTNSDMFSTTGYKHEYLYRENRKRWRSFLIYTKKSRIQTTGRFEFNYYEYRNSWWRSDRII